MNMYQDHGAKVMQDAFNTGDFSKFNAVLTDAKSKDARTRATGERALLGALVAAADIIENLRGKGVKFEGLSVPTRNELVYAYGKGVAEYSRAGQAVVNGITAARRTLGRRYLASFREAPDNEPATTTSTSRPIPVQVVSMPARKTVSDVSRDMAGEISGSIQFESDV